ncbi:integrase, partial [Rhodopirellula sp. MGV]
MTPHQKRRCELTQRLAEDMVIRKLAYSTFNQAVCALRFYYRHTQPMPWPVTAVPFGKRPKKLPTVLSRQEVD